MRSLLVVVAAVCLWTSVAFGYSGNGGVWGQKHSDFTSKNFAGTAAGIQAACDYIGANGGNVTIWPGTYDFGSTSLTITNPNIIIQGSGSRITKLTYSGSGDFIVLGANDGAHTGTAQAYNGVVSQVNFRDIWIQGPGKTSTARGIVDWESGGNFYKNMTISNFGTAYFGLGADVSEFQSVYFSTNGYGIYLGSRCDQNTVDNCYFADNKFGFYDEWSYGFRITNTQFVFGDTSDVVIDCRQDPTNGADTRNGSQRSMISGCWFEPDNVSEPPQHLWLGRFGTSARFLTGLTVIGCEAYSMDGEIFALNEGFSDLQLISNGYSGNAFTFVSISSVAGITPHIADLWNHMSSSVTRVAGAGSLTNYSAIGDSTVFRNPTEWRGSNGNIDIPTTGDRIQFTSGAANLIGSSVAGGTVRITAGASTNMLEITTSGVTTHGPHAVDNKLTAGDSLRANKGMYIGGQFVNKILRASASLNFDLTAATCQDLDITLTGAAEGDEVILGVPQGSLTTDITFSAWVKAGGGVVTVRACDGALAGNPASGTFKVTVLQ